MHTPETDSAAIPFPAIEETTPAAKGSYAAVRHNAMKHGILARLAVLPHEDAGEFDGLLAALIEEHRPETATERHLVEELAATIWRKRRVLLAEGATINRTLRCVAESDYDSPIPAAAPFDPELSEKDANLSWLVTATSEEIAKQQRDAEEDLLMTSKAVTILKRGGDTAYNKAIKTLRSDSRDWWEQCIADGEFTADLNGLEAFLAERLLPLCMRNERELHHHAAIKTQTYGQGLDAGQLENLGRYETHLDRKFERTLAMLVKLKELRGNAK
jgi:hypothetical protein